jgi:hypothetical protein
MGQKASQPSVSAAPDDTSDPCYPQLQSYLRCVESHSKGLTEGDDCSKESTEYKNCRNASKEWKKSKK